MRSNSTILFSYRPLVNIAGGMCISLLFSKLLNAPILAATAAIVFACVTILLYKLNFEKYALFTSACVYGALLYLISCLTDVYAFEPIISTGFLDEIRSSVKTCIDRLFGENSGMVTAMLLGNRDDIDFFTNNAYQISGIAHILALSGLHISIFSSALLLLIPKNRPVLREIIVGSFLLAYCTLTGFPASLVRASIMTLCLLSAPVFNRRSDSLSSISAAAIIILTFAPNMIDNVGFQLSFAAVIGIALLYKPIMAKLSFFYPSISSTIAVSLSATLGTMPLMIYHFSRISVYSMLANIIILPMVSIALICALLSVCLYLIFPTFAAIFAYIPSFLFSTITYFARAISNLPFSEITITRSSLVFLMLSYVAMVAVSRYCFAPQKRKLIFCSVSLLLGVFSLVIAQLG